VNVTLVAMVSLILVDDKENEGKEIFQFEQQVLD
jgi:hypothetical protein